MKYTAKSFKTIGTPAYSIDKVNKESSVLSPTLVNPLQDRIINPIPEDIATAALVATDQIEKKAPVLREPLRNSSKSTRSACIEEGNARSAPKAKPLRIHIAKKAIQFPEPKKIVKAKMIEA